MQRIRPLEPLVSLVEVVAVTAFAPHRQRDQRRIIFRTSAHICDPVDEIGQETRIVGHGTAHITVVLAVTAVDIGLVDHINADLVAKLVEPARLRIGYANRIVFLLFEAAKLTCRGNLIGRGIVSGDIQLRLTSVNHQHAVFQFGNVKSELERDILGNTPVAPDIEPHTVQVRRLRRPHFLYTRINVLFEAERVVSFGFHLGFEHIVG